MNGKPVALVTGAARGIGAATALEFARRGYDVGLTDILGDPLASVAKQVEQLGGRAIALAGDLADLAFGERFIGEAARSLGGIDVLVNNAAWREVLTMREITPESWDKTLRIGLTAPAFLAKWAAAHMEPRRRGVIVNISSIMARRSWGMSPAYVAVKGGLDSLTHDLAALYGPSGIRVLAIAPGAVDTDMSMTKRDGSTAEQEVAKRVRDWSEEMIAVRRMASSEEVARAIAMLASDDASYLTGTTVVVDGGWTAQLYPYNLKRALSPDQFP